MAKYYTHTQRSLFSIILKIILLQVIVYHKMAEQKSVLAKKRTAQPKSCAVIIIQLAAYAVSTS